MFKAPTDRPVGCPLALVLLVLVLLVVRRPISSMSFTRKNVERAWPTYHAAAGKAEHPILVYLVYLMKSQKKSWKTSAVSTTDCHEWLKLNFVQAAWYIRHVRWTRLFYTREYFIYNMDFVN